MRKFVIGDIRGSKYLLEKLIDKIEPKPGDNLIFLGSYLGPGEDSHGTVELLLDYREKFPDTFYFLRGCYEALIGNWISKADTRLAVIWEKHMNGREVIRSYFKTNGQARVVLPWGAFGESEVQIPKSHLNFFEDQTFWWYEDALLPFVAGHSGIPPMKDGGQAAFEACIFGTDSWWLNPGAVIPGKEILFSHIPFKEPFIGLGKIGIDLGAGLSQEGRLCAWEAFSREFLVISR